MAEELAIVRKTLSRSEEGRASVSHELAEKTKQAVDSERLLRSKISSLELQLADKSRREKNETVHDLIVARRYVIEKETEKKIEKKEKKNIRFHI